MTTTVPVVTSGGNVISNADIFWGNPRYAPPYTYLELNRSSSATFGQGSTPQRDVAITGVFGYSVDTRAGGTLAAAVSDTTGTSITVSDGSLIGIGDQVLIDSERLLVTERANVTSGQTLQANLTDSDADVTVAVTTGSNFHVDEVITLDSERMLIVDVTGNNLTVIRAWDGSVLATHSGSTVYVSRLLTAVRGSQGTVATTHTNGTAVSVHVVPSLVKQLTVAEAVASLTLEAAAYASSQGSGSATQRNVGAGLPMLRAQAQAVHGRVVRQRVI